MTIIRYLINSREKERGRGGGRGEGRGEGRGKGGGKGGGREGEGEGGGGEKRDGTFNLVHKYLHIEEMKTYLQVLVGSQPHYHKWLPNMREQSIIWTALPHTCTPILEY